VAKGSSYSAQGLGKNWEKKSVPKLGTQLLVFLKGRDAFVDAYSGKRRRKAAGESRRVLMRGTTEKQAPIGPGNGEKGAWSSPLTRK